MPYSIGGIKMKLLNQRLLEMKNSPMENTTTSYGYEHPTVCPVCRECELYASKHSDVDFEYMTADIVMIYCPKCKYEETVFSR